MMESPAPSKFAKWKRPFIGGLLSALIAGVFYSYTREIFGPNGEDVFVLILMGIGAMVPLLFVSDIIGSQGILAVTLLLLFWFLVGALICKFIKTNIYAISCWLLLYMICIAIGFGMMTGA